MKWYAAGAGLAAAAILFGACADATSPPAVDANRIQSKANPTSLDGTPTSTEGVTPTVIAHEGGEGDAVCAAINPAWSGFKVNPGNGTTAGITYEVHGGQDDTSPFFKENAYLDWSAAAGVVQAVIVKDGTNDAHLYTYNGSKTSDGDLRGTLNNGGQIGALSHFVFCFTEGEIPKAEDPTITKDAAGSYDNTYTWTIDKSVDKTTAELKPGGSVTFTYTVKITHDGGTTSNYNVSGKITVTNPNAAAIGIDGVTDELSDGTDCIVTGGSLTIPANGSVDFDYSCDLTGAPEAQLDNTATVTWSTQELAGGAVLDGGSKSALYEDISFTGTDIDECIDVTDPLDPQSPRTFCVGDAGEVNNAFSYTYTRTVTFDESQLGKCVQYDNTATFTTNDTETTGSDKVTVTVCFKYDALTIGYWGNHLATDGKKSGTDQCKYLKLPGGTSCSSNGPWAQTHLPKSLGNFSVNSVLLVAQVIAANNCSSSKDQDAVACLAAQLLAAKLNVAQFGGFACINTIIANADDFLINSVVYTGPTGKYTLTATQRATAVALKTQLDNYNNQKGC